MLRFAASSRLPLSFSTCLIAALLLCNPASTTDLKKKEPPTKNKPATVTVFGQVDEFSYVCSSAGVRISGAKIPGRVDKISLGSAAAYSGLRQGDQVLEAKYDDNSITLDIERQGRHYQAKIATNVRGVKEEFESRKIKFSLGDSPFDDELKKLRDINVVILLDRSKSMEDMHAGVPGDISKWMWCKEQIDNVYLATDRVLENGFDIYLFNDRVEGRTGVTLWDLHQVFDTIKPQGEHKSISAPLRMVLSEYFSRRKLDSKPCIILVITDGLENSGPTLQDVLIDASRQMSRQGEVIVNFLQVGDSIRAEELFDDLDRNLVAKGSRYRMVNFKPFAELRNRGVLYELLASVKDISKTPKPSK